MNTQHYLAFVHKSSLSRIVARARQMTVALLASCLALTFALAQSYNVTTIAGRPGLTGEGESGALFSAPYFMARDSDGNIFVTDALAHCIRKITPSGAVSLFAGSPGVAGDVDGIGAAAHFHNPAGVAVDANGNVYVADLLNHVIRKVTPSATVTTIAGTAGASGYSDAAGAAARFSSPFGVAVDATSNTLFVSEAGNSTIRKINLGTSAVTTLCGSAGVSGYQDGVGSAAKFNNPGGLALESNGNLLVADGGNKAIRRVTSAGAVTTVAGAPGINGTADGTGAAARFEQPIGIAVDGTSNTIFITDFAGQTVRQMTPGGSVTTLCGQPGLPGAVDGTGLNARLYSPTGIVVDGTSNTLIFANGGDATIRRVTYGGTCSQWLGRSGIAGNTDTTGVFDSVSGMVFDSSGNLFLSDLNNHAIRKVTRDGVISTFCGLIGTSGSTDGSTVSARFKSPVGLSIDSSGNIYVADQGNHTIRKITPAGNVSTLAGLAGVSGSANGAGNVARFNGPTGVAVDPSGSFVYVADFLNHVIRRITSAGVVTTIAGTAGISGSTDGIGAAARFNQPFGVTLDPSGTNLYVSERLSNVIRKIALATGTVTTVLGTAGLNGSTDGVGAAVRFNIPLGIAFDSAGNFYIADQIGQTIRKMTPAGVVTTSAGFSGKNGQVDGPGAMARFGGPVSLCVDAQDNVYVGEEVNHAVRKITPSGVVSTYAGVMGAGGTANTTGSFNSPAGIARDSSGNLYVCDGGGHVVRKISPSGVNKIIAGQYGVSGTTDASGSDARFNSPYALAVASNGIVYVADTLNHSIRRISTSGNVTTIAGLSATSGSADGVAAAARFNRPYGITIDSSGSVLYVTDYFNSTIRKVVIASGTVSTIAGQAGSASEGNGVGAAARFNGPQGISIDSTDSNLYVTDWVGQTVRKVTLPGAVVNTLAGLANTAGEVDGTGNAARFTNPEQCVVDASGNVFVTDAGGHTIRKVTAGGVVTTIAGAANSSGTQNGIGNAARFNTPSGITIDAGGVLYIADRNNQTIRKAARASAKAEMVSPVNGSTLTDAVTQFSWDPGVGASGYALWIGTTPGGYNVYAGNEGTNLSKKVTLPFDRKIYVTLYTIRSGVYSSNNYVYEPAPSMKSVLTRPTSGGTLGSASLSLQWSPGIGVTGYAVWVGSSPNGYDLGAAAFAAGTTSWTTTVPTDGGPVYVTLYSLINGAYQSNSYWFKAASLNAQLPAQITSHANTSTLTASNLTFSWGNAVGAAKYALWIGSTPDGYDLYAGDEGANLSKSVVLPNDGRRIYVTLHSLIGGVYQSNAYWFTSYTAPSNPGAAQITSHANGATFGAALTTLQWNNVVGATKYLLWVGTTPASYDWYAGDEGSNTSKQLTMPNDGRPVYVTLYTLGASLVSNSYFFTCANTAVGSRPALITSPANGSGIGGSTDFTWGGGNGATGYALWVGSSPGGYDLYAGNEGVNTSKSVTVPSDGRKIYVTLHSLIAGIYKPVSYVYTAAGSTPMTLVLPSNGGTFTSQSAEFFWMSGASSYALWIGRTPLSYDIYAGAEGANMSKTITNLLPNNGGPVYVTLYSLVNGVYVISDHIYNAWQQP